MGVLRILTRNGIIQARKGGIAMAEKKPKDSIKKLEDEFRAFQKEWKKFLANDFPHLTKDVGNLAKDVSGLKRDVSKTIGHIVALDRDQKATEKSIRVIDQNVLELLKRTK
jgi:hypothetical protein